jgi:hypothetical protein
MPVGLPVLSTVELELEGAGPTELPISEEVMIVVGCPLVVGKLPVERPEVRPPVLILINVEFPLGYKGFPNRALGLGLKAGREAYPPRKDPVIERAYAIATESAFILGALEL